MDTNPIFDPIHDTEAYRDSLSTIDKEGNRVWIYPKKPKGQLYNYRTIVSVVLIAIFFIQPFIKINGVPLLMLNIPARKFILYGLVFGPQDTFLFALTMITFMVFIVLFTTIFGRLWCGWTCPQTVFMEMVFRKIEYFIEGDAQQQRNLSKMPWNTEKIRKRGLKYFVFFAVSFIIANTFLAYIISVDELFKIISEPVSQHLVGLSMLLVFTGVFYFVFAYMREQVCLVVCPYGRLQGVLLDTNSIVVAYNDKRGEPRGKAKKGDTTQQHGDCIDCHACVHVCPTGIDIRNGVQLECINCTACIDACDSIMDKLERPRGLVGYNSLEGIRNNQGLKVTPRIMGYSAILGILLVGLSYGLLNRSDTETTILRTSGVMFQEIGTDSLSNLYNFKTVNKTHNDIPVRFELQGTQGQIKMVGHAKVVAPNEAIAEGEFFVVLPRTAIKNRKSEIQINVLSGDKVLETVKTNFLGTTKPKKTETHENEEEQPTEQHKDEHKDEHK